MTNEWHPHPKQEEALRRIEYEILYGGARGGGKTDAGLVWLTDYIDNPLFRALVIRKNADDLSDWVDRAGKFYRGLGADIAYRPAIIKFPSGAVIRTGHLKDDQAYTKYQGHEYQRILIEELTQIPDEKRYLQLLSSCRSTNPEIKPQVFCTTNPGGIGHGWVKRRFVDVAPANAVYRDTTSGRSRIYIPARVDDNPTLMTIDPDYVKFLDSFKNTDEELWKAWRLGDWNTFAGQYYKEWRTDLHVCNPFIPDKTSSIIVGGLDWGRVDPFAFYLVAISRIDYNGAKFYRAKVFCEVYGTEKTPEAWSKVISNNIKQYGIELKDIAWVRADTQIWSKGLDARALDIYTQFIQDDEAWRMLKPANKDRIGGWENLHRWLSIAPDGLPYLQFASNCINATQTIPELVHDENKVEDVDDKGNDHCLIKGTLIDTIKGRIPIENVKIGDLVLTRKGYKRVIVSKMTNSNARTYKVTFSNGSELIGTPNHPVWVKDKGFVFIDALRYNDRICTRLSFPQLFRSLMERGTIYVANIFNQMAKDFILLYGNITMVPSDVAFTYTTGMKIGQITIYRTYSALQLLSIYPTMQRNKPPIWNTWQRLGHSLRSGTPLKRAESGIVNTAKNHGRIRNITAGTVTSAIGRMRHHFLKGLNSVISTVKWRILDSDARVLRVKYHSIQPVYNLTIEGQHEYFANGILTHNSGDAIRYCFMALKWIDGSVGAMVHPQQTQSFIPQAPKFISGKQLSMDLDAFGGDDDNDNSVGGIVIK